MSLLQLLLDYQDDEGAVRDRIKGDIGSVLEEYEVKLEEYTAFRSLPVGVAVLLPYTIFKIWEGIVTSPPVVMGWPGPSLRVARMSPTEAVAGRPEIIELEIDVAPPDKTQREDPFNVDVSFRRAGTEASVQGVVQPLHIPPGAVSSQKFRCEVTFSEPGEYIAQVKVTLLRGDNPHHTTERTRADFEAMFGDLDVIKVVAATR